MLVANFKCYFCDNNDVKYCEMCGEYLCDNHRRNFPKRAIGMFAKKILKRREMRNKV